MKSTLLSYCVPIMNRLDDLKATLESNLQVIAPYASTVEMVVSCFDAGESTEQWVSSNFSEQMRAGYLRFIRQDPLPFWHFSWAKNSFGPHISGKYYSSLDGDNFLGKDEVERTLRLLEDDRLEYMIHHWSGSWGDGTSGRVTIPTWVYKDVGYLRNILPRQFDEIGLLLRAVEKYPWLVLVSRPGVDVIAESRYAKEFLEHNNLAINRMEVDLGSAESPRNPRGKGYVNKDEKLRLFQKVNADFTLYTASSNATAKEKFEARLKQDLSLLYRSSVRGEVVSVTFTGAALDKLTRSDALTVYSVVHNDFHLLPRWLEHYRALGVQRFIIVDDNSIPPLEEYLVDEDVYVLRPLVGDFKSFKVAWIRLLMAECQEPNSWVVTVDSDEFVDIPTRLHAGGSTGAPLVRFCQALDAKGQLHAPGLLIDLLPEGGINRSGGSFMDEMRFHLWRPPDDSSGYRSLKPIKWAFSNYWPASFRVDARHRLFNTIDCLRKIPVVKFDESVELNQGYHTLYRHSRQLSTEEIWFDPDVVLPIRHYKMCSLFLEADHLEERKKRTASYFGRTERNLVRIYRSDRDELLMTWRLTPFKKVYDKDRLYLECDVYD